MSRPQPSPRSKDPSAAARALFERLEMRRQRIDSAISDAMRGRTFTPAQLLALQAQVYAHNQEMEAVSRLVDKTVGALKTTLNTQL